MRIQWIVLALLAALAAALAASWGLGFWDEPAVPVAPSTPPPAPPRKEPAPLNTAAWMLAHTQPKQETPARPAQLDDDSACGDSRVVCPGDSVCIGGACLITVCSSADKPTSACALPNGEPGVCCGDRCVDRSSDRSSCGKCGVTCDHGLDCVAGRCEARACTGRMASVSCLTSGGGQGACCRGECVDQSAWKQDTANCGGCGHACAAGLVCQQGACLDPATGLRPSWNCFEAGHTCPDDSFCVIDACYPKACGSESDGQLCPGFADGPIGHCCDRVCTDLFSDQNNCRACGVRCGSGEICRNGECRVP